MKPGQETKLSTIKLIAYAAPVFPLSMMLGPVGNFLPLFYAKYTAISLTSIGLALLLGRLVDAFTDQIVGYLSDMTRSRFGRRKPWLVAGTLVCMASSFFLYMPSAESGFAYFFVSLLVLYLGWTMVSVPHLAWGAELTRNYNERAKISSFIAVLQPLGFALVLSLTFLPFLKSTELTPEVVAIMGLAMVAVLPLTVGASVAMVPAGIAAPHENPSLGELYRSVRFNRPFWRFMAFNILAYIGLGMMSSLIPIYMDFALGLGASISLAFIVNMVVMGASVPLWLRVVYRVGKHRALAISSALSIVILPTILLIKPGSGALLPFLLWMVALGAAGGTNAISVNAIMGDIVDYDTLRTRGNRAGNYYAFMGFLTKASGALGGGFAFLLLSLFGFDAKATSQSELALFGLKFSMAGLPLVLSVLAIALVFRFPLDARRHAIIKRRLEQREARQAKKET